MPTKFFEGAESPKSLIDKYKQYQKVGRDLTQKVFQEFSDSPSIRAVGKSLGIWQGGTLVLESEEEFNFIMDFSLFEYLVKGKNFIQRYQEKISELEPKESEFIKAQLSSYTSLFKIMETEPDDARVTLGDIFNDGQEVKVININLSQTAQPGLLVFTRILPFPEFNMTSGMYCFFSETSERYLLKRYQTMSKKVKSEIESVQRFIAFFKINRRKGLEIITTAEL
jgi:hypothetical protein